MKEIIIIPGGGILPIDVISPSLMVRCKKALELFQTGEYDYILVTGGKTQSMSSQTKPESWIIIDWLLDRGVPEGKIIFEDKSLDSFQNIEFGLDAIKNRGIRVNDVNFTITTQWQHAIRYWITLRWGYSFPGKVKLEMLFPKMTLKQTLTEFAFIGYHIFDRKGEGFLAEAHREKIRKDRMK